MANSIPGQNGKCVASPCIARSGGPGALCNDVEFFDVRPMPSSGIYYITLHHTPTQIINCHTSLNPKSLPDMGSRSTAISVLLPHSGARNRDSGLLSLGHILK